ncbi:hypothetical protein F0344_05120 [Streptomyces finlayi]|uniref:Collagen-like protein n=1 Tax=Streptomyces finlayi TaxID=67296 RepID=A0A7G7BFF2_9ACTN|nr:hypothetical protein [Streptomyces finlayi]QNE74067.1 hypothetical protein F0344_05120 [Streptomyces finlayi]
MDGKDGTHGKDGTDGETVTGPPGPAGPAGPNHPDGYSLLPPKNDPDALVCRRTTAEEPPPADQSHGLLGLGALTATAFYRRLDA